MKTTQALESYIDADGNHIDSSQVFENNIRIQFRGKNNRIIVSDHAHVDRLIVTFDGDNGVLHIGANSFKRSSLWNIRIGQDSTVKLGNEISSTATCVISAVEGTSVIIGDDVMIASGVQLRADDGHAIYDVKSRKRVNHSRSISIGNHVWLAFEVVVLGGVSIGDGTVIGFRSLVTKNISNNCIAVGMPAKVVREDIAWERPHLSISSPAYRPDASSITPTLEFWNLTERTPEAVSEPVLLTGTKLSLFRRVRRLLGRVRRQLTNWRTP